jgi:RNA polymerase-binding transcription factor DksA
VAIKKKAVTAKKKAPAKKKAAPKATKAVSKAAANGSTNGVARKTTKKPVKKTGGKVVAAATLASILGTMPKKKKSAKAQSANEVPSGIRSEWVKYYQRLLDLRNQLEGQMTGLAKESAEQMDGYSLHMADSGTDNFDRDFALGLLSADQDALYEINEALKRIERDSYGICELTGKSIPKARLNAIPWARFTVEAQAQLERDGAVGHKRLGKLGSVGSAGINDVEDSSDSDRASVKEAK